MNYEYLLCWSMQPWRNLQDHIGVKIETIEPLDNSTFKHPIILMFFCCFIDLSFLTVANSFHLSIRQYDALFHWPCYNVTVAAVAARVSADWRPPSKIHTYIHHANHTMQWHSILYVPSRIIRAHWSAPCNLTYIYIFIWLMTLTTYPVTLPASIHPIPVNQSRISL